MDDMGINQIKFYIQWNIIGVLNSMGVIKVSEPQTVWNRACWSYFLGRISHSRSVCAAATRELALNLILKETNILFSQSLCTTQPNRGVRILDGKRCNNVIFRWRAYKSKNTSSYVNAPTTVIKHPWQYFCTYLYKEIPAGWLVFFCFLFFVKQRQRWVELLLYLNSRQWHWSGERHPVGAHGPGAQEWGDIPTALRRCNKWSREVPWTRAFNGRSRCFQPLSHS